MKDTEAIARALPVQVGALGVRDFLGRLERLGFTVVAGAFGQPAVLHNLPPGVAVDGEGRWWLLPGHPMPQGAQYRYRHDDEWRTPVFAPDSPEMTTCWSALQAHEIRMAP